MKKTTNNGFRLSMLDIVKYGLRKAIDWAFRKKSVALALIGAGTPLIGLGAVSGEMISFGLQNSDTSINFQWFPNGDATPLMSYVTFGLGVILTVTGAIWSIVIYRHDREDNERKTIIAIEQRGLLPDTNSPLDKSLPETFKGKVEPILINHTPYIHNSIVSDPEAALRTVQSLRHDIQRITNGRDRSDISIVYGGVSPVPLTFFAGFICDDENHITLMDWHRTSGSWKILDGKDTGLSPAVPTMGHIPLDTPEVALIVEMSYRIDERTVQEAVGDIPQLRCSLEIPKPDTHWSYDFQQRFAQAFLQTMAGIIGLNVEKVHLFIAAPNSLVFKLGKTYDKNLSPQALVYQYQKGSSPKHPWAAQLPVQGEYDAKIVWSS